MTPDDLRQTIELQVVELLKQGLAEGTVTDARGQQISQHVLDMLKPGMSYPQLYKAISKLDDTMQELAPIVAPVLRQYEDAINRQVTEGVASLIRQGQYDAATKLAQQAINQDVDVVLHASAKPDK